MLGTEPKLLSAKGIAQSADRERKTVGRGQGAAKSNALRTFNRRLTQIDTEEYALIAERKATN